ncbi:hypothetical protein FISHEDRAFT_44045 [Fistulina hepatica ATCC 64428]|uniref:BTB domain-containing protein n=1 Tax=Fistulina hepatica ATCC 64428 TaxID=1128425 RepID=A0A0D7ADT3_9AGAR|nr:hypothetical protein FISHEDRAFT_44045 [Fistulina hepatica ATCC 64428]
MNQSNEHFSSLRRHEEYFLSGGDLFFLIQHTIFRVHRYFYERESDFFRNILATPASPGALRQGTAEANAIVLDNITPDEFAKFNWVFYNPKYSLYNRPVEDWTVILSLAHRWGFPEVHALAVRELEKLEFPDLDRIVVYHKYDVDRRLLVTRYAALCEREEPLTVEEGARLGMETAMTIAQGREIARAIPATPGGPRLPKAAGLPFEEMAVIIKNLFGVVPPSPVESPAGLIPRKASLSTATVSTLGSRIFCQ